MRRLSVLPFVIFFLCVGLYGLDRLGLYCDETIFISAALGDSDGMLIHEQIFGIPLYIMPYIGALKSWLHAPIFWAFGVNAWSVRVPGILISLAAILLFAWVVQRRFGLGWALATLLLLCTDPGFLLMSRGDFGPTVIMSFMKALALFGFFRWLKTPSPASLSLWLAALTLGIWNKLDFLWILIAFGAAALVLYGKDMLVILREQRRRVRLPIALFGVALLGFALGPIRQTLSAPPTPGSSLEGWDRLVHIWQLFIYTFDSRAMSGFHFPGVVHPATEVLLLPLAGLCVLPFLLTSRARSAGRHRLPLFFLISALLIFAQAVITPQAGGTHHLLLLWPLPQLFAIAAFASLHLELGKLAGRIALIASTLLILFVTETQVRAEFHYLSLLSNPELSSPRWTPKIYDLSRELEARDVDLIISTDWGLYPQLSSLAVAGERSKYVERWPAMRTLATDPAQAEHLLELVSGKRLVFVLQSERTEVLPPARSNTLHFLDANFPDREVMAITDDTGRPLYELHAVDNR